ncbi:toxin-antitoxin system YwqK family antitoxin [Streptomyces avermitilis]|uniref:toxin-antitoxin system YwqK family antitoxin n=1 Tax=Streptomyces avermitilis TaxID=33903 RepID=UPI00371CFB15
MKRIDIDDPEVDMDLSLRLLYRGELFTGEVEEYLGGVRVSLASYADGFPHGPSRSWHKNGTRQSEGTLRTGSPAGVWRTWHPNGALAVRMVMSDDGARQLARFEWDEDGKLTKEWHADGHADGG